jgi:hypothetical protein
METFIGDTKYSDMIEAVIHEIPDSLSSKSSIKEISPANENRNVTLNNITSLNDIQNDN